MSAISCSPSGGCAGLFKGSSGIGVPVTVQKVDTRLSSPVVDAVGTLMPSDRADITIPYNAKIEKVFVKEGDQVKAGTPLFKISEEDISSRLTNLRASRREAEAILEKNTYLLKNRERLTEEGKTDAAQLEKEVAASEATVDRIRTEIATLERELEKLNITSPISGTVIKQSIYDGSFATANEVLLSIINTNPILVSFPLTADEAGGIQKGTPIEVKIDELGGEIRRAEVTYISPELHQAGKTFDVWASIENSDGTLKAGMRARASFRSAKLHKIFVIPTSALIQKGSHVYVFVVKDGLAKEIKVTPKEITKNQASIIDGLSEDDLVVVKGGSSLQNGTPVDIWR